MPTNGTFTCSRCQRPDISPGLPASSVRDAANDPFAVDFLSRPIMTPVDGLHCLFHPATAPPATLPETHRDARVANSHFQRVDRPLPPLTVAYPCMHHEDIPSTMSTLAAPSTTDVFAFKEAAIATVAAAT
ncbi:hypothetical protein ACLOJK_029434, partial [Asimina triloba]